MTKQTAGILGSLTEDMLRRLTDAELDAKATAIEDMADDDGFLSLGDEADLCLINREQARREDAAAQPPQWFLVEVGYDVLLVQARSGADIEDVLKREGYSDRARTSWQPLADCTYGVLTATTLKVIPAVTR